MHPHKYMAKYAWFRKNEGTSETQRDPSRPLSLASSVVIVGSGGLVTLGPLSLKRRVGLVGLVELSEELNIRNKGVNLLHDFVFHSQTCVIIPDLFKMV